MMTQTFLSAGGLAHITSLPGGSKTRFALNCLSGLFDPSSPLSSPSAEALTTPTEYFMFIADEGFLYPPALRRAHRVPLSRLLLVKVRSSEEVWKAGLEALQTGIFSWLLLRPSRACPAAHLRRLQLEAERSRTRVLVLGRGKLPHWMFQVSLQVPANPAVATWRRRGSVRGDTDAPYPVYPKWFYQLDARFQRSLSRVDAKAVSS